VGKPGRKNGRHNPAGAIPGTAEYLRAAGASTNPGKAL
jgi:hypothetical protein